VIDVGGGRESRRSASAFGMRGGTVDTGLLGVSAGCDTRRTIGGLA
jgi:hypothetical protein